MKLVVFGASGSGTTTLASTLASELGWTHLDADDFYWAKTEIPFERKNSVEERQVALKEAFLASENVIVSGSLVSWSNYWLTAFDLAVFLWIPPAIRMERLGNREYERYGEQLYQEETIRQKSKAFLAWAAKYDDINFEGRNIVLHEAWSKQLSCDVLELKGDLSNEKRKEIVVQKIALL